jgi:hypothetical protein
MEDGFLQSVITVITSDTAVFWLSWLGLAAGFVLSIWIASRFYGIVKEINEAAIFADQDIPFYKIRKPILNKIQKLEGKAKNGLATVAWRSSAMLFFGMIVPGLLLALLVHFQHRLIPGPPILLMADQVLPQGSVSYFDTAVFVLDQALKGGLNDLMEVFGLSVSPITNNPEQGVYTTMVYLFRLTCGTIGGGMVYAAIKVFTGTRALNQAIANLKRQLKEMDAQTTNG